jgi:hypothetical protein
MRLKRGTPAEGRIEKAIAARTKIGRVGHRKDVSRCGLPPSLWMKSKKRIDLVLAFGMKYGTCDIQQLASRL